MGNWERIFEETEGRHADCRRRLRDERPALLNLGEEGGFDIRPWANRVRLVDARYAGTWELPVIGVVTAPTAVLIRPDGYVAWVGDTSQRGLAEALSTCSDPPV
ncbi:MAG TPA: hypothetical protein VFW94_16680 [Candidatus Acidoferrales bacterium]|nr:hypothetical protein [Candidatus Acidoferrales bacterium]